MNAQQTQNDWRDTTSGKLYKCSYKGSFTMVIAADEKQARIKAILEYQKAGVNSIYDTEIKVTEIIQPTTPENLTETLQNSIAEQIEKKYENGEYAIKDFMHAGKLAAWLNEDDGDIMINSLLIYNKETAFEFAVWYDMATSIRNKIIERNEQAEEERQIREDYIDNLSPKQIHYLENR